MARIVLEDTTKQNTTCSYWSCFGLLLLLYYVKRVHPCPLHGSRYEICRVTAFHPFILFSILNSLLRVLLVSEFSVRQESDDNHYSSYGVDLSILGDPLWETQAPVSHYPSRCSSQYVNQLGKRDRNVDRDVRGIIDNQGPREASCVLPCGWIEEVETRWRHSVNEWAPFSTSFKRACKYGATRYSGCGRSAHHAEELWEKSVRKPERYSNEAENSLNRDTASK